MLKSKFVSVSASVYNFLIKCRALETFAKANSNKILAKYVISGYKSEKDDDLKVNNTLFRKKIINDLRLY